MLYVLIPLHSFAWCRYLNCEWLEFSSKKRDFDLFVNSYDELSPFASQVNAETSHFFTWKLNTKIRQNETIGGCEIGSFGQISWCYKTNWFKKLLLQKENKKRNKNKTFYHLASFDDHRVRVVDQHVEAKRLQQTALKCNNLFAIFPIFLI